MKAKRRRHGPFNRPKPVLKFVAGHGLSLVYRNNEGYNSVIGLDAKVTPDGKIAEFATKGDTDADRILALRDRIRRGRPTSRAFVSVVIQGAHGQLSVDKCSGWEAKDRRAFRKYRRHEREDQAALIRQTGMMNVLRSLRKEHENVKLLAHRTVKSTYTMAAPAIGIDNNYLLEMRLLKGTYTWVLVDINAGRNICRTADTIKAMAALKKAKLKAFLNV